MTYLDQWRALSSRICGLVQAGRLDAGYLAVKSSDAYGRYKRLREHCERILAVLNHFRNGFRELLPPAAEKAISDFISHHGSLISDTSGSHDSQQERVWAALVFLAALETEVSFLLSDVQEAIRSRSERAFSHLQRSIVADEDVQAKWSKAFDSGQVACEKLGAVHLLLHGIWAFKVDAAGARTDLVFQDSPADITNVQQYADGLVLTEWKKAAEDALSGDCFKVAKSQAKLYAAGALATTELTGYRYLVVVSRDQV